MPRDDPKSIVLIGAGHTHALAMLRLQDALPKETRLTLIDPLAHAVYSGMLPGCVARHYQLDELKISLAALSERVGATFIQDRVREIDPVSKRLSLGNGKHVSYDVASFDIGATSKLSGLNGFDNHAVPVKPLEAFTSMWDTYLTRTDSGLIAVIGGGVAGSELAMAMAFALQQRNLKYQITVVDRDEVLADLSKSARRRILKAFQAFGIITSEHASVREVTADGLVLETGQLVDADLIIGAAGAVPHQWIETTPLRQYNGYIEVNAQLQSSDPDVFAVGDCAHFTKRPLPKAGVFAVRQAPVLSHNLIAAISGAHLKAYKPQSDFLKLITLGGKTALADKFGITISGKWVWALKNRIDSDFMRRFR
ncbi:MAG: FAD-dependent oxidoreductase [Pseudomonadota bacterium]